MARIAIVTGASRGLGKRIAEKLQTADCITITDRVEATDYAAIDRLVASVVDRHGRIDVLVNNAAILGPVGELERCAWARWEYTIGVDLLGPAYWMSAVLPIMKRQQRGKIINIAGGGVGGSLPRRSAYAVAKIGLVKLTECVADECKGTGVYVNAMLPGPMMTDMMRDIVSAGPERLGNAEFSEHSRFDDENAIDRAADLCFYLASEASGGLSGKVISARYDKWPFDATEIDRLMAGDQHTIRRVK